MEQIYGRMLIFDGSHALHRNLCEPHLWEMKNSKGVKTGGVYGVLNTILKESSLYNYMPIVVFDGKLSQRRLDLFPNYKHHLDKQVLLEDTHIMTETEIFAQEQKEEYNRQREILKPLLESFGIPVLHFENWEGDDIIYILSKICKDSIVVSDDKDLIQLVRDDETGRCRVKRGMRNEFIDNAYLNEKNITTADFIAAKAIVGDSSDNIPSACYGVGEKTADGLFKLYTETKRNNKVFPKTEEELAVVCKELNLPKRKAYINFDENQFLTNLMLMDLSLVEELDLSSENIIEKIVEKVKQIVYNFDVENIKSILNELDIKTFIINNLLDNVDKTTPFIDSNNITENILDIIQPKLGKLF